MSEQWDYKKAGLDLEKYEETISGIQPLLARTHDRLRVIPPPFPPRKGGKGVGGFASLFDLDPDAWLFRRRYKHPVLVTCTDGVGSKLKIAVPDGEVRHGRHRPRRHVGQRPHLHRRRTARLPRLPRDAEGRPAADARSS